jgi:predicted protein tyrosine phosphatase
MSFDVFNVVERVERRKLSRLNKAEVAEQSILSLDFCDRLKFVSMPELC